MTTKKILMIVAAVVISIGLLITIFVGGIVGFVFYSIHNSEAAFAARDFLRNNDRLKQDIGDVKEFGRFVTGNVNISNGDGAATLNLKVIGERKTVNASVELIYRNGREWRVTAASYRNEAGQTISLFDAYESLMAIPPRLLLV
jgi:Cytochrome oxidase complex assembly protein 1